MSTVRMSLCLAVVVLVAVFASPAIAATGGSMTYQANLQKIDPALFAAPVASASGATSSRELTVLSSGTVAIVKLHNYASPAWAAGGHDYVVESLKAVADRTQAPVVQLVLEQGGSVLNRLWLSNSLLVSADDATFRLIAQNPSVESITPNHAVSLPPEEIATAQPAQGPYEWNIEKIGAPEAWALGITGTGVRVCVSDTGFDVTHPDVGPRLFTLNPSDPAYPGGWMEFDANGNPVSSTPHDTYGHGTHVSGTIAGGSLGGTAIGVAPGVSLMEALILPGGGGTDQEVIAGIQWCVDPTDAGGNPTGYPAHVLSMSWGNSAGLQTIMLDPVRNALLAGVIPVAAAGNCGEGCVGTPGDVWGVFAAGATDANDNVANFSSGKTVHWPSPPADWPFFGTYPATYIKPDFSAPGVNVKSTYPGGGYLYASGTSMATPHLSASVALMLEASAFSLTPEQAYLNLVNSVIDYGAPGQDDRWGYGRLDTYHAVLLSLVKNTGVRGSVLDSASLIPISGVRVTANELGLSIRTADNGTFRMGLPEGSYTIGFDRFGYYPTTIPIVVTLYNGTLQGTVVDRDGTPINAARIDVVQANVTTSTDPSGFYQVSVKAGHYTVVASTPSLLPATADLDVEENATTVANFTLYPDLPAILHGTVTYAGNGTPIAGALVWAYGPSSYQATTDAAGSFVMSISQADAGAYTVGAFKGGFWPGRTNADVVPGGTLTAYFALVPSSSNTVAVYQDWNGELATLLDAAGFNAVDYQAPHAVDLLWDLSAFSVVYWSGFVDENITTHPTAQTFTQILALGDALGVSFVFGDSYNGWPYGIELLSLYLGTPTYRDYAYDSGDASYTILANHPIFQGVGGIGDQVTIIRNTMPGDGDFTWFLGFNGTTLATTRSTGSNVSGDGAAVLDRASGTEWVLLASLSPQVWTHVSNDWTPAAKMIAANAVSFGRSHSWASGSGSGGQARFGMPSASTVPAAPPYGAMAWVDLTVYLDPVPSGTVAGTVRDTDGNPLSGATVAALGTPVANTTGGDGSYAMQLPIGSYTIQARTFGYRPSLGNVTVLEGQTTTLDFALVPQEKVGIMYDDMSSPLQTLLEGTNLFAVAQYAGNWDDLIAAVPNLDLVILSGSLYGAVWPTQSQFTALLAAADSAHAGILFLDNVYGYGSPWGYQAPYGISLLTQYLGDPSYRSEPSGCSGTTYEEVTMAHRITRGYGVGEAPALATTSCMPFSYFGGFSGATVGRIWTGYGTPISLWGDNLAFKTTAGGSRWALLGGYAPVFGYAQYWTDAMRTFFVNAAIWATTAPLLVHISPALGPVGTNVTFSGSLAPAGASLILSFDGIQFGTTAATGTGTFGGTFVIPEATHGPHALTVETVDQAYGGDAAFLVVPSLTLSPTHGPPGTVVVVSGHGFGMNAAIELQFPGMDPAKAESSGSGILAAYIMIPNVNGGDYPVTAIEYNAGVTVQAMFRVIEAVSLDVQATSGVLHFRGEVVTFYVLVTSNGELADATITAALYLPDGATTSLTASRVSAGLYEAMYTLPGTAPTGTYALVARASVNEVYRQGTGAALASFLVSPTLTSQNALILSMQGDIAQVQTDMGLILLNLTAVGARVTSIQGNMATITTSVGTMQASFEDLGATITSVQGDIAHLHSHLGDQSVQLSALQTTGGSVSMFAAVAAAGFSAVAALVGVGYWLRLRRSKQP